MIRIFTEGRDKDFLDIYLPYIVEEKHIEFEVISTGGYTSLELLKNKFLENTDIGGTNLVIFDADYEDFGGGYEKRSAYLLGERERLGIDFSLFLFPNNEADGNFEDFLESMGNPHYHGVFHCFNRYNACIQNLIEEGLPSLKVPLKKSKIYAYVDAFDKTAEESKKFKKSFFLYDSPLIWNLESPAIQPLKSFLMTYLGIDH